MFQLEHELKEWTNRFGRMEVMRSSDIEELEQHVRDSIAVFRTKGLSEEEAFLIATHRVGQSDPVGREFAKVNGGHVWGHRVFWMLAGELFFEVCRTIITGLACLSQALTALAGGEWPVMGFAFVVTTALLWLGLAIWLYRSSVSHNDKHSIGRFLAQSRGKLIGITLVVVFLSVLMRVGSEMVISMTVPIAGIGWAMYIGTLANSLFAILIPVAFLFIMRSIRLRLRDTVTTEQ